MELVYLPYSHHELPTQKTFKIHDNYYNVTIYYNDRFDIYTIIICDSNDTCLFAGKLSYLRNTLDAVVPGIDHNMKIITLIIEDAMREISQIERISSRNFDSVRICVT